MNKTLNFSNSIFHTLYIVNHRYLELQGYCKNQEKILQRCTKLMKKLTFEKKKKKNQKEEDEIKANKNKEEGDFKRSYFSTSPVFSQLLTARSTFEQDRHLTMPDEASPSPVHEHRNSKIALPPPPRQAVMPAAEDVKKSVFFPPIPPRRVFSQATGIPSSKSKPVQDYVPQYSKNGSAGYGKYTTKGAPQPPPYLQNSQEIVGGSTTTETTGRQHQAINPPLVARKPLGGFPSLQNTQQCLSSSNGATSSRQSSQDHQEGIHKYFAPLPSSIAQKPAQAVFKPLIFTRQHFMQYDESLAIKRSTKRTSTTEMIAEPEDSTVRPSAHKQTVVTTQEVVGKGSIRSEQELLSMIPQPPLRPNNNNKIHASVRSRIPSLPTIQHGMSGIPTPCPPPQPPTMPRSRPRATHRRYVAKEVALPFPRRQ